MRLQAGFGPDGHDRDAHWWTTERTRVMAEAMRARLADRALSFTVGADESEPPDDPPPDDVVEPDQYVELTGSVAGDDVIIAVLDGGVDVSVDGFSDDEKAVRVAALQILDVVEEATGWTWDGRAAFEAECREYGVG